MASEGDAERALLASLDVNL